MLQHKSEYNMKSDSSIEKTPVGVIDGGGDGDKKSLEKNSSTTPPLPNGKDSVRASTAKKKPRELWAPFIPNLFSNRSQVIIPNN